MPHRPIDNRLDFLSPVSLIPGLGARRIAALKESGIETIKDLLYYFPRKHIDRSVILPISELAGHIGKKVCVIGTVTRTRVERGRSARFRIQVTDDSGSFEVLWFHGITYFRNTITAGKRLLFTGIVNIYSSCQMVHPDVEPISAGSSGPETAYLPVYPVTEAMRDAGIGQKGLIKAIKWILDNLKHYPQILPRAIEEKKGFPSLDACLKNIHFPDNPALSQDFTKRLCYEELYQLALTLRWSRRKFALPGRSMKSMEMKTRLEESLPFKLTDGQKKAISILHTDSAGNKRMHRLLEGDVGSGKTIVAFFACLPALESGMQVAWMAPTEVLAGQTFKRLQSWLDLFSLKAGLLTGSTDTSKRRELIRDLVSGKCRFIVGTHALLQPQVQFSRLGMVVIDEQHKFGTEQRTILAEKDCTADFLLMSATPIPQTLAKTLYGDLDIVTIRGLPEGRRAVGTHVVPENKRQDMIKFITEKITSEGVQAYFVVPRIDTDDENEKVRDIDNVSASLAVGPLAEIPKAVIHSRIKSDEKERIFDDFSTGKIKLLLSTTVIEVGIDVPQATIMVIENSERFGLSQLHQLRGRVGRGRRQGYCFCMVGENIDEDSRKRLSAFCRTNDGFEIADLDLQLRGPGDVVGLRQSGWNDLKIADIIRDSKLFREIQEEIDKLLER